MLKKISIIIVIMQEENFSEMESQMDSMNPTTQESQDSQDIDRTALFLEIIQNYSFLYDLSHRDYRDNEKKNNAWRSIGEALGWSGKDKIGGYG